MGSWFRDRYILSLFSRFTYFFHSSFFIARTSCASGRYMRWNWSGIFCLCCQRHDALCLITFANSLFRKIWCRWFMLSINFVEYSQVVHEATVERGAYPSPLNYHQFPKSVCTSVNEVICHGIPDFRWPHNPIIYPTLQHYFAYAYLWLYDCLRHLNSSDFYFWTDKDQARLN